MVRKLVYLAGIAMVATSGVALAQTTDSKSTTGSVTIVTPLALAKNAELVFGNVYRPATGAGSATVTMPTSSDTPTGSTLASGGPTRSRAAFTVTGEVGKAYSVTVPANFTMTRSGGGSLVVTLNSSKATGTLTAGTDTFHVGGSFALADNTAAGDYSGTFNVQVDYQ